MVQHPEVQAKAQVELDAVIGHGNLPTFDDEDSLPYLMALVKECLRWQTILPIGVPHLLTADDEYNGFSLPAGAIIIPNSWYVVRSK